VADQLGVPAIENSQAPRVVLAEPSCACACRSATSRNTVLFTLLARGFDDPDILRRPSRQVLERFAAGGSRLVLTWWGFAMSAVLLVPRLTRQIAGRAAMPAAA
jgi:hypothetical protein